MKNSEIFWTIILIIVSIIFCIVFFDIAIIIFGIYIFWCISDTISTYTLDFEPYTIENLSNCNILKYLIPIIKKFNQFLNK